MIRATFLLTLALTVATGETAMLVCQTVCDRGVEADAGTCRHAQPAASASMTNDANCLSLGLPATATPRVELDRSDSHEATLAAVSNEALTTTSAPAFAWAVSLLRVGSPPRIIVLRI